MSFKKVMAFIKLTRPFFLLGGVLLYLLGVVIALNEGVGFNLGHFLAGQALVTSIQLMVQYSNEYYDREVDAAAGENRTWFSGGSGALASGAVGPGVALAAARVCGAASLVLLVVAAIQAPLAGMLGGLAILAGWAYSAPPLKLMRRGWGELNASLIVAFLTPLTGLLLQAGIKPLPLVFFAASLPLVLIHMAMLVAFEFPDRENDLSFGKRTLVVQLGPRRAVWLHNGLLGLAFGLYAGFVLAGLAGTAGRYVLFVLPLAAWQAIWIGWLASRIEIGKIHRGEQARFPSQKGEASGFSLLVTGAVGLVGLTAILWLAGLIA
jgi:1,4-dihydroxy-2-naphthoate polyprenyltransferase